MTDDRDARRTYRREWIKPPNPPDENTIAGLREILLTQSRISEAWVVGSRMTPIDGSETRESSDIAVVFDPPLPDNGEQVKLFVNLMEVLDANGHGLGTGRGWLIVGHELVAAHAGHATRIYSRSTETT